MFSSSPKIYTEPKKKLFLDELRDIFFFSLIVSQKVLVFS